MKKSVGAILVNDKKQLLMFLRDDKPTIIHPGYWSMLAGSVEKGETLLQALKREIKEEINYDLGRVVYLGDFDDLLGSWVFVYKSRIDKRLDELILTEGQRLNYFHFDEVLNLKIPCVLRDFLVRNKDRIIT